MTKTKQETPGKGPREDKKSPKKHTDKYQKKYEKEHFPRKVWPTDSENKKHKGPKI